MRLILASISPRRKEILRRFGFEFDVIKSGYDEKDFAESVEGLVKTFAIKKAEYVFDRLSEEKKTQSVVLGADTVVALDGVILGKPKNNEEAFDMLKRLSGKEHGVFTGYAVVTSKKTITGVAKTKVFFNRLSEKTIREYVATGSPLDKAGGYGIQDGFSLVKAYEGSLYNVIGLPIEELEPILKQFSV